MSSKFSNKFPIPEQFPLILHDFIKEVIRNKPQDILDFSIHYFTNLEKKYNFNLGNGFDVKIENESIDREETKANNINNTNEINNFEITELTNLQEKKKEIENQKEIIGNNKIDNNIENNNNNLEIEEEKEVCPLTTEMAMIINEREEMKKKKEAKDEEIKQNENKSRTPSNYSVISGTSSQKKEVNNFVDDLFVSSYND